MSRRGFTLIEVLVALTISGLVIALAAAVFGTSTDALRRLSAEGRSWDSLADARMWLTEVLASAEVDPLNGVGFEGGPTDLHFHGWQRVPEGWLEPAEFEVRVDDGHEVLSSSLGLKVALVDSLSFGRIDYLDSLGADAAWLSSWSERDALPRAVRIRIRRDSLTPADTLLILIRGGQ